MLDETQEEELWRLRAVEIEALHTFEITLDELFRRFSAMSETIDALSATLKETDEILIERNNECIRLRTELAGMKEQFARMKGQKSWHRSGREPKRDSLYKRTPVPRFPKL